MRSNLCKYLVIVLLITSLLASSCNSLSKRSSKNRERKNEPISKKEFKKVMSECGFGIPDSEDWPEHRDEAYWLVKNWIGYAYDYDIEAFYYTFKNESDAKDYLESVYEDFNNVEKYSGDIEYDRESKSGQSWGNDDDRSCKLIVDVAKNNNKYKLYGVWIQIEDVVISVSTEEAQVDIYRCIVDDIIAEFGYGEGDGNLEEDLELLWYQAAFDDYHTYTEKTTTTKPNPTTTATFETELITEPEEPSETTERTTTTTEYVELTDAAELYNSIMESEGFEVRWISCDERDDLVAYSWADDNGNDVSFVYWEYINEQAAEDVFNHDYESMLEDETTISVEKDNNIIRQKYDNGDGFEKYFYDLWVDNYVIYAIFYPSDKDTVEAIISRLDTEMITETEESDQSKGSDPTDTEPVDTTKATDDTTSTTAPAGPAGTLKDIPAKKVTVTPDTFTAAIRAVDAKAADGVISFGSETNVGDYTVSDYYSAQQEDWNVLYICYVFKTAEDAKGYFDTYTEYMEDYATSYVVEADWGYVAYQSGDYALSYYLSDNYLVTVTSLDGSAENIDKVSGFFEALFD